MADEAPKLIVALEARLDKFEKQLKEAGLIAEREMRAIEGKIAAGSFAGSFLGNLASTAVKQGLNVLVSAVEEAIDRFVQLGKVSKLVGLEMNELFGIQEAFRRFGTPIEETTRGVRTLAELLNQMRRGEENSLSRLLEANPHALKEINKDLTNVQRALEVVANLVKQAENPLDKIDFAKLAGFSEKAVPALEKGAEQMRQLQKAAAQSAPDLQRLTNEADFFQKAWERAISSFTNRVKDFATKIFEFARGNSIASFNDRFFFNDREARKSTDTRDPNQPTTKPPTRTTAAADNLKDALDRQADALNKNILLEQKQLETIGLTVSKQEEARQIALLTAAAEKAGLDANTAITDQMRNQAAIAGLLKQQVVETQARWNEMQSASKEFGSTLSTAMQDLVLHGKKFDEVLRNIINRLASRAFDKIFDIIFAAPAGGGGSIFTSLLGLNRRAAGGPVSGGKPYMVGESGPELFVPNRSGMIMPNTSLSRGGAMGGFTLAPVYNIDASGADQAAIVRLEAALRASNATIEARALRAVNQHAQRYQ